MTLKELRHQRVMTLMVAIIFTAVTALSVYAAFQSPWCWLGVAGSLIVTIASYIGLIDLNYEIRMVTRRALEQSLTLLSYGYKADGSKDNPFISYSDLVERFHHDA